MPLTAQCQAVTSTVRNNNELWLGHSAPIDLISKREQRGVHVHVMMYVCMYTPDLLFSGVLSNTLKPLYGTEGGAKNAGAAG